MRTLIRGLDRLLRRAQGVVEFCDDPQCLFRIQRGYCPRPMRLSDGTALQPGEPIVFFHLWNEHVPPLNAAGADLPWAAKARRMLLHSMRLLAKAVATDPALAEARAIAGVSALTPLQDESGATQLMRRLGFDVLPRPPGPLGRFGLFWENLYTWALMWTFNMATLRSKQLLRMERNELWMSRRRLLERYGDRRREP